jgi:hypothetical protein
MKKELISALIIATVGDGLIIQKKMSPFKKD